MVRTIVGFAALLGAIAASAQQRPLLDAPACSIDKAVYQLKGAPEITAGFAKLTHGQTNSDLLLWVHTTKRTFWFGFASPNGYGGVWLTPSVSPALLLAQDENEDGVPAKAIRDWKKSIEAANETEDPLKTITFDAFKPDLSSFDAPPQSQDPAPARLFMRGIGQALWYSWTWAAAGDETAKQESIPTTMWEPKECS